MPARVITLLVPLCLLLVAERAVGQTRTRVQEYTPPYEVTDKDLNPLYGRYEIYEAVEYRGSITNTADEGQAWVGQELIVTATLFRYPSGLRIENPVYTVWYYPDQPEGNVPSRGERWSSFYLEGGGQAEGDEVIKVYKPGGTEPDGPWVYLEIIGTNELWVRFSGWYYKARKVSLRGYVDVVSRLDNKPLTLYGWAYNPAAPTDTIPVEIYVGGAQGTGTLAETIMADQEREDVNDAFGITGDHGFEWVVDTDYQSGAQEFYVYALDQSLNPPVRTRLDPAPLVLLEVGHADYCARHGPCVSGHGDCDGTSQCQEGLTCVDDVGENYGFRADIDVCEASLRGYAGVVSWRSGSLTLYGWAYHTSTPAASIPVEIYVGGPRDSTGTLAETITANQPSPEVNRVHGITGDHGFAWAVPAQYQSGAQEFYVYALDQTLDPSEWVALTLAPLVLLEVGHAEYCARHGPCVSGHGDCDGTSQCQEGLTCVDDVGANYEFGADIDVCTAEPPPSLRGRVEEVSRQRGSLRLSGWAYNESASAESIPVEIYVGDAQGSERLEATINANRRRKGVNDTFRITGNHGFAWPVPPKYRSGEQEFSVYALDRTPNPSMRTQLTHSPITLHALGHAAYCAQHGPCSAGQGGCGNDSECLSGLRCMRDVGERYGFGTLTDVCEVPETPTQVTAPGILAPTVTASATSATSGSASWSVSTNLSVLGYRYRLGGGSWTTTTATGTSATFTGLSPSTAYTVDVQVNYLSGIGTQYGSTGSASFTTSAAPVGSDQAGSLSITGTVGTDQPFDAQLSDSDGIGTATFQWTQAGTTNTSFGPIPHSSTIYRDLNTRRTSATSFQSSVTTTTPASTTITSVSVTVTYADDFGTHTLTATKSQ